MENQNHTYSSYPNSHDSSPRSREIDYETPSWDDQPPPQPPLSKVKFMCSYGGKIQPRAHDNQLSYVAGDTKILSVDRSVKFSTLISKLNFFSSDYAAAADNVCVKYQLPGEDLDALISVTNDEDLEHMMIEYDRLCRASNKPARLRLFLFPISLTTPTSFDSNSSKSERQWFVDALNSVQLQVPENLSSPKNPDFLFGLDKSGADSDAKLENNAVDPVPIANLIIKKNDSNADVLGSDCGSEDRGPVTDPVMSQIEIQRQIQELQKLQIAAANQEQHGILQRRNDEIIPRVYTGDYYAQQPQPETIAPPPQGVPMTYQQATYWPEQNMTTGGQHLYMNMIPTHSGSIYQTQQTMRPLGQVNQPYYNMPRIIPGEQPVYNAFPQSSIQQTIVRSPMGESGYAQGQFMYDRQVYYTTAAGSSVVAPSYQNVAPPPVSVAVDARQGAVLNQEGKVVVNVVKAAPQTSSGVGY